MSQKCLDANRIAETAADIVGRYGDDAWSVAAGQAAHLAIHDHTMAARWVLIADAIGRTG